MAIQDQEPVMLATDRQDDTRQPYNQQRLESNEQLDDVKAEHHEHEKIYEGGQPPRPMLTTSSEQDPDVAPDIQIRAISKSSARIQTAQPNVALTDSFRRFNSRHYHCRLVLDLAALHNHLP